MPKDWNIAYEENDTPWDKGYAAPPLAEFLGRHSITGRVLVPGSGAGHDVRLLAEQGAEVVGMDIAPGALRIAKKFDLAGNEDYALSDFLNLETRYHGAFDWVVEHTCLCAIDPSHRVAYAKAVEAALRPGGQYLAIFYREVSDRSKDGPPYEIGAGEIDALFGDAFELIERYVPQQTYPSRPVGVEELCLWRLRSTRPRSSCG